MNSLVVRPASEQDDFLQIALCVYLTDPFIYPAAFGCDHENAMQAIAALMQIEGNLLHYSNFIVACADEEICGVILYNQSGATWDEKVCNSMVKDYVPSLDNFIFVSKSYFSVAAVSPPANQIEIVACSVLPKFRNIGVAKKMLTWLCKQLSDMEFALDVLADNPAALALYTKCGFVITEQKKGFSIDLSARPNCYHMVRKLPCN